MGKTVALFQTQTVATQAMDDLLNMHFQDLETAVYEGPSEDRGSVGGTLTDATAPLGAGVMRPTGSTPLLIPLTGMNMDMDSDDEEFFQQGYQNGATVVIIDSRDADDQRVRDVLAKHGARFSSED